MEEKEKKTPLHNLHLAAGAKMIGFGGWVMPVQYRDILEEHRCVRERVGIFDVSHMGEITVPGPGAQELVQGLITNDISVMEDGRVLYSPMCNDDGGVVDDILVYRFSSDGYMLVVNASNTEKDLAWIKKHNQGNADIEDVSGITALLALQGPRAANVLEMAGFNPASLKYYRFVKGQVAGKKCLVSRTGYTGEDGFEFYISPKDVEHVWQSLLEAGGIHGILPVGLGARDTLRFEASFPLYGHELDENITPLEAGLDRFVKLHKYFFTGSEALKDQCGRGIFRRLVGLSMEERGIPRSGYPVFIDGRQEGWVTSGNYCPTLGGSFAMAYVPCGVKEGSGVEVSIRGKNCGARVVSLPLYKKKGAISNDTGRFSLQ